MSKTNINIKQITAEIKNQIKSEASYKRSDNKLKGATSLNNKEHASYYNKYKKMAEIQVELFKGIIETAGYLKKNNVLQKHKEIFTLAKIGKQYISHVNSFKGISNYADVVVGHKLLLLSFSKAGITTHMTMLEKTIKMLKDASRSIKEQNNKYQSEVQSLTESDDILLELDALKALKTIGSKFLGAIKVTFGALIEGWLFILKEMQPVVKSIKDQIAKVKASYKDNFVKGAKFVLGKLNSDMLEDAITLLGDEVVDDSIFKFGNMAITGIAAMLGFAAIPVALSALSAVETGLGYAMQASEVAGMADFINDAINMGADLEGLDDL